MLPLLKAILENQDDAFPRALAAAEVHIAKSGGAWFGVGAKGCFLLLKSGTYSNSDQGRPYSRAGHELLEAALSAAKGDTSLEAHLLHFLAGCAYAGCDVADQQFERAVEQFAFSNEGRDGLDDWCFDWCQILLASAALKANNPTASKSYFRKVSDRDTAKAADLFQLWSEQRA